MSTDIELAPEASWHRWEGPEEEGVAHHPIASSPVGVVGVGVGAGVVLLRMPIHTSCWRVYLLPIGVFLFGWFWLLGNLAPEFGSTLGVGGLLALGALALLFAGVVAAVQTVAIEIDQHGVIECQRIGGRQRMNFSDMDQISVQRSDGAGVQLEVPQGMKLLGGSFTHERYRVLFHHRAADQPSLACSPRDLDAFLTALRRTRGRELIIYRG